MPFGPCTVFLEHCQQHCVINLRHLCSAQMCSDVLPPARQGKRTFCMIAAVLSKSVFAGSMAVLVQANTASMSISTCSAASGSDTDMRTHVPCEMRQHKPQSIAAWWQGPGFAARCFAEAAPSLSQVSSAMECPRLRCTETMGHDLSRVWNL